MKGASTEQRQRSNGDYLNRAQSYEVLRNLNEFFKRYFASAKKNRLKILVGKCGKSVNGEFPKQLTR